MSHIECAISDSNSVSLIFLNRMINRFENKKDFHWLYNRVLVLLNLGKYVHNNHIPAQIPLIILIT